MTFAASPGASRRKTRILFADNHPAYLDSQSEFLEREGYQVIKATTPTEARKILRTGQVDVAILDLHLEHDRSKLDKSGLEVAKEFIERVPSIILTSEKDAQSVVGVAREMSVVLKSEPNDTLLRAIRDALVPAVFLVHGRDERARDSVRTFLQSEGVQVVVLWEQPGGTLSLLEKLERYSRVQFAVVLLTGDDVGGLREERIRTSQLKSRSRQNVIFELGFFIGCLGRDRVVALYEAGVELPSDYAGVQYLSMADAGWMSRLVAELKAGGLKIPRR